MNKTTSELFNLLSSCTAVMVDGESLLFPLKVESMSEAPELEYEFPNLSEAEIEEKIEKGAIQAFLFDHASHEETIHCHADFERNPDGTFVGKNTHGEEIEILPLFPVS